MNCLELGCTFDIIYEQSWILVKVPARLNVSVCVFKARLCSALIGAQLEACLASAARRADLSSCGGQTQRHSPLLKTLTRTKCFSQEL